MEISIIPLEDYPIDHPVLPMKTACLSVALVFLAVPIWAQVPKADAAKPTPLSAPLLHSVPNYAQWEIIFTYPDEVSKKHKSSHKTEVPPANARPRKIVTTRTNTIIHEEQTDVLNQTVETWYNGSIQYTKPPNNSTWYQSDQSTKGAAASVAYRPFPATGYRDMELVREENYAGIASYDDRKCLIFTPGGSQKLDLGDANKAQKLLKSVKTIAYVDADSRLPVAVQTPESLRAFKFDPPPAKMLELPDELVQQIKNGEEANKRLAQPASRPF